MKIEQILLLYLVAVNLVAFVLMGIDKWKAKKHKWRIPEKTLFLPVVLGGGIGGIVGMQYFRHKTKHKAFVIGYPAILILQAILVICVIIYI